MSRRKVPKHNFVPSQMLLDTLAAERDTAWLERDEAIKKTALADSYMIEAAQNRKALAMLSEAVEELLTDKPDLRIRASFMLAWGNAQAILSKLRREGKLIDNKS